MLQIINTGAPTIASDDYYIQHADTGLDELHFQISLMDPAYSAIVEQGRILETTENQRYIVVRINAGKASADISAQLDLSDWKKDIFLPSGDTQGFSHERTEAGMLQYIMQNAAGLSSWSMVSLVQTSKRRTIEMAGPTPFEVVQQMVKTFGCAVRFNTMQKKATILYPDELELEQMFAVDTVNLLEPPSYKGSTSDLYTRIYPFGKDGLGIGTVNGGLPYVENLTYTQDIICKLWKDERYTSAAELKADAQAKVDEASRPVQSWQLKIVDLNRINPVKWPDMSIELFTKLVLVDRYRKTRSTVQVREDKIYPYHPERTEITVSTATQNVQRTVKMLSEDIQNPNSEFWQIINSR